jgi:hypothetical protein
LWLTNLTGSPSRLAARHSKTHTVQQR